MAHNRIRSFVLDIVPRFEQFHLLDGTLDSLLQIVEYWNILTFGQITQIGPASIVVFDRCRCQLEIEYKKMKLKNLPESARFIVIAYLIVSNNAIVGQHLHAQYHIIS